MAEPGDSTRSHAWSDPSTGRLEPRVLAAFVDDAAPHADRLALLAHIAQSPIDRAILEDVIWLIEESR